MSEFGILHCKAALKCCLMAPVWLHWCCEWILSGLVALKFMAFLRWSGYTPFRTRHGPAILALIKLEDSSKWFT